MVRAYAYSPSRLQVYQTCARKYYYQYIIKVPTRRDAAQSVGISLHGALEDVLQAGGVEQTGIEGALALLMARWESEGFKDEAEEAAAKQRAQALLTKYLQAGETDARPVMLEAKLEAAFDGVPLLGIVDRVDQRPDGTFELIDYKSGQQRALTPAVRQQLAIYRYLIKEKLGEFPAVVSLHYLSANTRVAVDLEPGEWDGTVRRAAESARAIEVDEDYNPQVGSWCNRCDFSFRCLAYKRSLQDVAV